MTSQTGRQTIDLNYLEEALAEYGYPKNEFLKDTIISIPAMTSYQYLMNNIKDYEAVVAMTFMGRKITYKKFAMEINRTADALKWLNLNDGDRIGVLLPNIPEAAYMQYGPSKIGVSVSNIDPRTNSDTLLKYVKKEKLKAIIVVAELYELSVKPIEKQLKNNCSIEKIVVVPGTNSIPILLKALKKVSDLKKGQKKLSSDVVNIIYWNDFIKYGVKQNAEEVKYVPNKEALIQHSSGTSGEPKSIPLTNENINMFVEGHRPTEFGDLRPGTKMLHILPYFAAYGAINSAHLGFNFGMTMQEIPAFDFSDFGYIAHKNKSEVVIGVPNWFNAASQDKRLVGKDMSHILMAISGGAKNSIIGKKTDDEFLMSVNARCIETNGHGMSEICGSGSYQFKNHQNGIGIGVPFPYVKYIIVDKNDDIVPMKEGGIEGEAYIYSPSATSGFFDGVRFAETKDFFGYTFINSKDTIHINPNYEMYFTDREDRQFTRYDGHKIIPAEVEQIITESDSIVNAIVVPYQDSENKGQMPIAYIIPDTSISEVEFPRLIEELISKFMKSTKVTTREIPKKIKFVKDFPQNSMSKNDYKSLEKRQLDGTEFTILIEENNLSVAGYSIIAPRKTVTKSTRS